MKNIFKIGTYVLKKRRFNNAWIKSAPITTYAEYVTMTSYAIV